MKVIYQKGKCAALIHINGRLVGSFENHQNFKFRARPTVTLECDGRSIVQVGDKWLPDGDLPYGMDGLLGERLFRVCLKAAKQRAAWRLVKPSRSRWNREPSANNGRLGPEERRWQGCARVGNVGLADQRRSALTSTRRVQMSVELSNQIRRLMKTFGLVVPPSKGGPFRTPNGFAFFSAIR